MSRLDPARASLELHRVREEPALSTADLDQIEAFLSPESTRGQPWSSVHIGLLFEATSFLALHPDHPDSADARAIKSNIARVLHSYERSFWRDALQNWESEELLTPAQLAIEELVFGARRLTVGATDWVEQDAWRATFRTSLFRIRDHEIGPGRPLPMRVVAALRYAELALEYFLGSGADAPPPSPRPGAPEWVDSLHGRLPRDVVVVLSHWLVQAIACSTSRPPQARGIPFIPTRVPRHVIGEVLLRHLLNGTEEFCRASAS